MKTLDELTLDEATLDARIMGAAIDGDVAALTALEQERATLPAMIRAARLAQIPGEIAALEAEYIATKVDTDTLRAAVVAAEQAVLSAQRAHQVALRNAGMAVNEREGLQSAIRQLRDERERLIAEQTGFAETQRAPIMRSLWHARPPAPR